MSTQVHNFIQMIRWSQTVQLPDDIDTNLKLKLKLKRLDIKQTVAQLSNLEDCHQYQNPSGI
jgi:hypothetical protein